MWLQELRWLLTVGCCLSIHRVRQQSIDDSIIKYRDLLENAVLCSPGINRWYRVLRIFLTISPVRHSNRRYSSVIKNRDLLHKYLVVPITTHTNVICKSIGKNKRIGRQRRKKKGYYIPIQDHPVSSRSRRSLLLSVVGNIYGC